MAEHSLPQPTPIKLSPAALHATRAPEPHLDSEEGVRNDRYRTAQELEPVQGQRLVESRTEDLPSPVLRSRVYLARNRSDGGDLNRVATGASTVRDDSEQHEYRLEEQGPHWYDTAVRFWKTHISVTIDEGSQRDHLALERTFLGYLRTSLAFAMAGVIIAQLFRLQHSVNPDEFGYHALGIPLSATFISMAIVILFMGAHRFWRQQSAMIRGKIHAGGWEITSIMGLTILLCLVAFALLVAIDVVKSYP